MENQKKKRGLNATEWILIATILVSAITILILAVFGGKWVQDGNVVTFNFIISCLMFGYGGEQSFTAFLFIAFIYLNVLIALIGLGYAIGSKAPRSMVGLLSFLIGAAVLVYSGVFFYKVIQPMLDNANAWNLTHPDDQALAYSSTLWCMIAVVGTLSIIVYLLSLSSLTMTIAEATRKNLGRREERRLNSEAEAEVKEYVANFLSRTNRRKQYEPIWTTEQIDFKDLHDRAKHILRKAEYDEIVFDEGKAIFVNVKEGGEREAATDLMICVWKYDNAIVKQLLVNFMDREEEVTDIAHEEVKEEVKEPVQQSVVAQPAENKTVERYVEKTIIIHDGGQPAPAPVVAPVVAPVIEAAPVEDDDKISPERIPFVEKLEKSEKDIQNKYNELKAYLLGYGVKSRISISGDTFRLHKEEHAVIAIAGKHLKVYLPLNVKDYKDTAIPVVDASHFKKYENLPLALNVRSDLSVKRAKQLIDDAMKKKGLEFKEPVEKNYTRIAISGAKQK